jgi:peptidoglycan/xylan/chitin deacetylase (PgdA/CDA1 family)
VKYSIYFLTLCLFFFVINLNAQQIAFTFDDGPHMDDTLFMSSADCNNALLHQLKEANIKAAIFLTVKDKNGERLNLVRKWGEQGHMIGNHTVTHPYFPSSKVSLNDYEKEVLGCDSVISKMPGYSKRFRFTFLKEGDTEEKRDGFRAFLKSIGYKPAPVSIDASDWYYNSVLHDLLKKNPKADLAKFKEVYLHHLWSRACYYDSLSNIVLGRSAKHIILLHHNLINAMFLNDAIKMFREHKWKVIDAKESFEDPLYEMKPNTLPAGESILWALAKEKGLEGLRYPGEDDTYEKDYLKQAGFIKD